MLVGVSMLGTAGGGIIGLGRDIATINPNTRGTLISAAINDMATQIQIATGVPNLSDIIPNTKGDRAAPKFITVILTPWQNPLYNQRHYVFS